MNHLFAILRFPMHQDAYILVRSLIALRLIILALTTLTYVSWHLFYGQEIAASNSLAPTSLILYLSIGLAVLCAWSVCVLNNNQLLNHERAILRELLLDFLWVMLFVLLSGRSANPFIYYYLVLTALGACVLPAKQAWALCFSGIALYSSLLLFDMRQHFAHFSSDYRIHLVGMWINFVASTVVTCFFITRLNQILKIQQKQLSSVREENLKSEQLIGLATVAASTVHNLATPISTLGLLVDELLTSPQLADDTQNDLHLMKKQIDRCHHTMKQLSSLAQESAEQHIIPVAEFVTFLQEHYSLHSPSRTPTFHHSSSPRTFICCNSLFQYAVINLINNALESSAGPVQVIIETEANMVIKIHNSSSLPIETLSKRWGKPDLSEKDYGLGIGSFLANSTIEKQGGSVSLSTKNQGDKTGIEVTISMPLAPNEQA